MLIIIQCINMNIISKMFLYKESGPSSFTFVLYSWGSSRVYTVYRQVTGNKCTMLRYRNYIYIVEMHLPIVLSLLTFTACTTRY